MALRQATHAQTTASTHRMHKALASKVPGRARAAEGLAGSTRDKTRFDFTTTTPVSRRDRIREIEQALSTPRSSRTSRRCRA
jgi:alanyl-tRNA synthetase